MKVSVYKGVEGRMSVLIEASQGAGKPPVLLRDLTIGTLRENLAPVLLGQQRPRPLGYLPAL